MLPENVAYADTGCDLFSSCLQCPLARCRYDEPPGGLRRLMTDARDREIALIRRRHRAPINALAQTYGLTRRSIFRILSEQGHSDDQRSDVKTEVGAKARLPTRGQHAPESTRNSPAANNGGTAARASGGRSSLGAPVAGKNVRRALKHIGNSVLAGSPEADCSRNEKTSTRVV
jgi:hypothetical protein